MQIYPRILARKQILQAIFLPPLGGGTEKYMKATGIVRRIDDLGRVVIPKEIRRTMRIREGDPTLTSLTPVTRFLYAIMDISKRFGVDHEA